MSSSHVWGARLLALALLGALALMAPSPVSARGKTSDSVVKVTATADKIGADGKQVVTLNLAIEAPWYIYANPVGHPEYLDLQTTVAVTGKAPLRSVRIEYPKPAEVKDKTVGDYNIYKEKAVIKAFVQRAVGDTGPLRVSVKIQSCDKNKCLVPATVRVEVP